jgi:hypothetical protein
MQKDSLPHHEENGMGSVGLRVFSSRELFQYQQQLMRGTTQALSASTFRERSELMGNTVATVSAYLAAVSLSENPSKVTPRLERVFRKITDEVGRAFEPFFDEKGRPRAGKSLDQRYYEDEEPMSAGREIAFKYWREGLNALGINRYTETELKVLLTRVRQNFPNTVEITRHALRMKPPGVLHEGHVKDTLRRSLPLDEKPKYRKAIDQLPFFSSQPLSFEELKALSLYVRFSQAAYLAQQIHRREKENDPRRTDPTHRRIYMPFDSVVTRNFQTYVRVIGSEATVLGTALVETLKDLDETPAVRRVRRRGNKE